jgi:hypothetical protein
MKHHIDLVQRQFSAFGQHSRLLGQDVKIKPHAVPGGDGVSICGLRRQVLDQIAVLNQSEMEILVRSGCI